MKVVGKHDQNIPQMVGFFMQIYHGRKQQKHILKQTQANKSKSKGPMFIYVVLFSFLKKIIGFLRGGCPRGGGNWGTLRIPREDWGTLGNIREY